MEVLKMNSLTQSSASKEDAHSLASDLHDHLRGRAHHVAKQHARPCCVDIATSHAVASSLAAIRRDCSLLTNPIDLQQIMLAAITEILVNEVLYCEVVQR